MTECVAGRIRNVLRYAWHLGLRVTNSMRFRCYVS